MKRSTLFLGWAISAGWSAVGTRAEEFAVIGPRAMGMGGAGVAATRGSLSTYWNPAGLAPPRAPRVSSIFDQATHLSVNGVATKDVLGEIDGLIDAAEEVDFDAMHQAFENPGGVPLQQLDDAGRDTLRLLERISRLSASGTGLLANATPGINFGIGLPTGGRAGFSAMALVNGGGLVNLDTSFLALGNVGIDQIFTGVNVPVTAEGQALASSLEQTLAARGVANASVIAGEMAFQAEQAGVDVASGGFEDLLNQVVQTTPGPGDPPVDPSEFFSMNQSGFNLRGIALQEYAVAYAQPLFGLVSVGASAKLLYGMTYFNPFTLNDLDEFGDVLDELTDESLRDEGFNFGLDLGVLFTPTDWLAVGAVGKYLNEPSFDFPGPGDYTIAPQARAGLALGPFLGFTLAADIDLTENESEALPGFQSRVVGGGLEYNLADTLFLRGGVSKNLAESSEDVVFHAGLGLRFFGVALDAAAMMSGDFTEINADSLEDPDELPERVGASLMLSFAVPLD